MTKTCENHGRTMTLQPAERLGLRPNWACAQGCEIQATADELRGPDHRLSNPDDE